MSDHNEHGSPFIQHHFDGAKHQFDSGKLGIWAFLAQEVLFFSALFVAYIVFRYNHPEVFAYAHKYLDVKWGAINTAVLIVSSLSAAWAVRAAQKNQQQLLLGCLIATVLCACGFLGIKYIEYSHKFHEDIEFGCNFAPNVTPDGHKIEWPEGFKSDFAGKGNRFDASNKSNCMALNIYDAKVVGVGPAEGESVEALKAGAEGAEGADNAAPKKDAPSKYATLPPPNTSMFFTIYFAMTGLHGIHVLVGIFVFIWLIVRAKKGHFGPEYFGPVDFAALYWHIVDLIWIYLFPLLYLIH
jgi:cytochrome c oxidase subunit 3